MSSAQDVQRTAMTASSEVDSPAVSWDIGTAYDFFMSIEVLHHPDDFGLRASWAAGVRSRLPNDERKLLEEIQSFLWAPLHWVYTLPEPKDAAAAIWGLRQVSPSRRPLTLTNPYEIKPEHLEVLQRVNEIRKWDSHDLEIIRTELNEHKKGNLAKDLPAYLDWWARPDELGELYLSAIESYYKEYFAEEEKRIEPALKDSLAHAQELAERMPLPDLLAELSQGIHFDEPFKVRELVLVPGYWNTPLIVFPNIGPDRMVYMFGARPANASLVPGEPVPDMLLRVLKALADPTRLRILHYLSQEMLTPAQLARKLRLRAPTVTHHLNALRLAGLVHVKLESGGEKCYASRLEAIQSTCGNLESYLRSGSAEEKES